MSLVHLNRISNQFTDPKSIGNNNIRVANGVARIHIALVIACGLLLLFNRKMLRWPRLLRQHRQMQVEHMHYDDDDDDPVERKTEKYFYWNSLCLKWFNWIVEALSRASLMQLQININTKHCQIRNIYQIRVLHTLW